MTAKKEKVQKSARIHVWYDGGRKFSGGKSIWKGLPEDGVLAVQVEFNDGLKRNCVGDDWYGLMPHADGSWTIIHNSLSQAENEKRYPNVVWKRGRWTSDAEIHRVVAEMG